MPEGRDSGVLQASTLMPSGESEARAALVPVQHFYRTTALACPYLPDQFERKLVTELAGREAPEFYNDLCRAGFRRSHHLAYRPSCVGCNSCVPVRVVTAGFADTRSTRRVRRLNADLVGRMASAQATVEQFRLFIRYERSRHAHSEMAAMTFGDYRAMIEDSPIDTRVIEFRDGERELRGICLVDTLDDGHSAVYSFFDPALPRRSLGTFMVLWLIDDARRAALPYVYLGYWIAASDKMAYKTRFRPLEQLGAAGWGPLEP
jgi:arginyl-tRNA--protein-N-Asp/Glu arginylyltransferase